jgi:uncharacterized protein
MLDLLDPAVGGAGLFVGFVVGLTGMGGGALMTPILVLFFGVQPLAAVSSDLLASMIMKPLGGAVHLKQGTVNRELVTWLVLGSVPSAFAGSWALNSFGTGESLQGFVKLALGIALSLVTLGLIVRPLLQKRHAVLGSIAPLHVRRGYTFAIGLLGGLVVGLTSVGSGSLMMILLLLLYPRISLKSLVGTDLVQAVPLVSAAALGHALFGDLKLALTGSILIGSIPGVLIGARLSSRAPDYVIRPSLIVVLTASALKLLGTPNDVLAVVGSASVLAAVWFMLRERRAARRREANQAAAVQAAEDVLGSAQSIPDPAQ